MSPNNLSPETSKYFLIEITRLTVSLEVFHSSLAQSAGELWLKVLGKILAKSLRQNFGSLGTWVCIAVDTSWEPQR